ncbi:transposase [Actinacidiphila alni]|uniref:transposase n=1 Tax=Actinacidiphila alni TaxID=380248 RepID=UPI0033CA8A80
MVGHDRCDDSAGNRNDVTQLIRSWRRRRPCRADAAARGGAPVSSLADRGYDHDKYRRPVWGLGVRPLVSCRGTEHGSGLGTQRWVVERAFAHLHWFRRLRIRWEIRDDIHEAFLTLGCALICWRRLNTPRRIEAETAVAGSWSRDPAPGGTPSPSSRTRPRSAGAPPTT